MSPDLTTAAAEEPETPSAAILLAEQVIHMEMVTERGLRARELARQVLAADAGVQEGECAAVLRELASMLSAGGYNAPAVDAATFKEKILWGIDQLRATPTAPIHPATPEGWQLVPKTVTPKLRGALLACEAGEFTVQGGWDHILAACPQPPKDPS